MEDWYWPASQLPQTRSLAVVEHWDVCFWPATHALHGEHSAPVNVLEDWYCPVSQSEQKWLADAEGVFPYLPCTHVAHTISAFSSEVKVDRHGEQDSDVLNEPVPSGDDMYVSAGQHPYRAVQVPRLSYSGFKLANTCVKAQYHLLPHNVRLNPLL